MVKNNEYSLKKSDITPDEFEKLLKGEGVQNAIECNLRNALGTNLVLEKKGMFGIKDFARQFTFDGSLKTKGDPADGQYGQFFKQEGRVSQKGNSFLLRGPRYLVSIDPALEVRQKLDILKHDFTDAIDVLSLNRSDISREHFIEQSAVLDYAKNAAITLFNSLVQREKIGEFLLDNTEYQHLRKTTRDLAKSASYAYYAHFAGRTNDYTTALTELIDTYEQFSDITGYVENQYLEGIFSSRYFTRPEAGHPLVIASSVYTATRNIKELPNTIIGLPSGGTELAFAQQYAYKMLRHEEPTMVLVPLSLHSIKDAFGAEEIDTAGFRAYLNRRRKDLEGKRILIIEDNSSTGRTIQILINLLRETVGVENINVSVAEADLIRSQIDSEAEHRTHVASAKVYENTVHILPISRTIKPKVDMREMAEKKRILSNYKKKLEMAKIPQEEMLYRALTHMCEHPTQEVLRELNEENAILEFRYTFLSNFYTVPIKHEDITYPSVEHAYQAQKFTPEVLVGVTKKHIDEINEILHYRGQAKTFKDARHFFTDTAMSSGNVKVVADKLREYKYVRPNWDDDKLFLMTHLLIEKFKDPEMCRRLVETGDKYLVEGNTWNDTLWGVSGGRGRNLLGLMLMDLRERISG